METNLLVKVRVLKNKTRQRSSGVNSKRRSVETGPYMEALTLSVRKQGQKKGRLLLSKAGFRATSLSGTLGSWGHERQTGKADLSCLDHNPLSASVYSHQGLGGNHTGSNYTTAVCRDAARILTGGRICEAVFSSFLLLVAAGTHRTGRCSCCCLGPRDWLSVLSPAVPPHSVLLCRHHSFCVRLPGNRACHMGNNPDIQSSLNY